MKKLLVIALSAMMLFAFTACQPAGTTPTGKAITTDKDLIDAAAEGGEYYLDADITLTAQLDIASEFYLDGNGKTITRDVNGQSDDTRGENSIIQILNNANSVYITDLVIDGRVTSTPEDWVDGQWGIQVYGDTTDSVILDDITVKNINAGIQVYDGASATVTGDITFENAWYGGIGVDSSANASTLSTLGATFASNDNTHPVVYLESDAKGELDDAYSNLSDAYTPAAETKASQIWYFVDGTEVSENIATPVESTTPEV